MNVFCLSVAVLLAFLAECVQAEKLTLAHVAINPGQGMLLLAKDSGLLAKYGFTADVVLIPGTPRTVQALVAGDLDYAVAGTPAVLRARMQGADVIVLASLAAYSSQRVFVRPLKPLPYPDDEGLRAELEQINAPKSPGPEHYLNVSFLDELRKNGFVDKLYKQKGGDDGEDQTYRD